MNIRSLLVVGTLAFIAGCAQFTTNRTDRADLEAIAGKAGDDYVTCVVNAADRYEQTGEATALIIEVAKKACTASREAFVNAENASLKTQFMRTEPILQTELAALDQRATQQVQQAQERALELKVASPSVAAAVIAPVASLPATSVPTTRATAAAVPSDGNAYLKCMSAEGQRYAGVNEPAEVIAEVAQSRCSALLTDAASAAQLAKQGRALVMGMVLDRKVSGP